MTSPQGIDAVMVTELCPHCGATGHLESDMELVTTELMDKLDYIHGKVTAIWNKIKDK